MPQIPCPACKETIYDTDAVCPFCGFNQHPNKQTSFQPQTPDPQLQQLQLKLSNAISSIHTCLIVICVLMLIGSSLFVIEMYNRYQDRREAKEAIQSYQDNIKKAQDDAAQVFKKAQEDAQQNLRKSQEDLQRALNGLPR